MSATTDEIPTVDASVLARYEPYGATIPAADHLPLERLSVERATPVRGGWEVKSTAGWCCIVPRVRAEHPTPEPGDMLVTYGGIGREIQGMRLVKADEDGHGTVLWYRSEEQRDEHSRRMLADIRASQERDFDRNRDQRDRDVAALPPKFRARIEGLRAKDPKFRVESEGYELFVLTEAVKLARALKTEAAVREFVDMTYEQQVSAVPDLANDQHSGWTHSCMCQFAIALINDIEV